LPPPQLSGCCRFGQWTFAGAHGNGHRCAESCHPAHMHRRSNASFKRQTLQVALHDPRERVPLLGKQSLHPIDYRTHAGGAAQIAVDNDPVFGRDFGDRRG
jgi:hypothetical protein